MVKTLNLNLRIPATREVRIKLPSDVPVGPADVQVTVSSKGDEPGHTLGELADSPFFGMWRDRDDITDSAEFARHLRGVPSQQAT